MRRLHTRMQRDVIAFPIPNVANVDQQIVDLIAIATHLAKLLDRRLHEAALRVNRIQIHHDQNDAVARRRHLTVEKKRLVICRVKLKVIVELQRSIFSPNPVQLRN